MALNLLIQISARVSKVKWVTLLTTESTEIRSINRVTKWVTVFRIPFCFYTMKKKFSKKGKGGKVLRTPEEQKKASSHAGQKLQKWKEEDMREAERLWKFNETLPPNERLSRRQISIGISKTTVIERLCGRCKN